MCAYSSNILIRFDFYRINLTPPLFRIPTSASVLTFTKLATEVISESMKQLLMKTCVGLCCMPVIRSNDFAIELH